MTKERVCANGPTMSRRTLLTALPVSGVALTLPSPARAHDRDAILEVIQELETWQGWEPTNTIAAKAYAAYRMRQVLELSLPNPKYAQLHIDYQAWIFEEYKKSYRCERDQVEGKMILPPRDRISA